MNQLNTEDIIISKSWHELTQDEKAFISELASTEDEFNLVKNIILYSSDGMSGDPELSAEVKSKIEAVVFSKEKKGFNLSWFKYAAAILILVLTTVWLFNKPVTVPAISDTTTGNPPAIVKRNNPVNIPVDTASRKIEAPVARLQKDHRDTKHTGQHIKKQVSQSLIADTSFILASNIELLDLVTEVY